MKKTFPVNINGSVYYVDEDAYDMLNNYLEQLRLAFPGREGEEIIADIEARISEIFAEMCAGSVVTVADVNRIIETMGRPADLSDAAEESQPEAESTAHSEGPVPPPFTGAATAPVGHKRLFRDMQNKMLGGVLSGLAAYMNWNANILRLLVVIIALVTTLWPVVICYLVAWMVIPPAVTMKQILEMRGEPVTVDSVSQSVLDNIMTESANKLGPLGTFFSVLLKIFMILLGIVGACVALGGVIVMIVTLSGLIVLAATGSDALLDNIGMFSYHGNPVTYGIGTICASLAILLPCAVLAWACFGSLNRGHRLKSSTAFTLLIVEVVLVIAAVVFVNISTYSCVVSIPATQLLSGAATTALTAYCG